MKRQGADDPLFTSVRFPDGGVIAVGAVEMDRAGRVLFRVAVPTGEGMCGHARIVMEGLGPAGHEAIRTALIAGLARGGEISTADTAEVALGGFPNVAAGRC